MNTDMTLSINCDSSDATERLGERLGYNLRGGEIIELVSDLGSGKTTLTRGIVRGCGSGDVVGSPTFTLSKVYAGHKFSIFHFDFYRLTEPGIMEHELEDVMHDPHAVLLIEWGEIVEHILPEQRLTIHITKINEASRQFKLSFPERFKYLVEGLQPE